MRISAILAALAALSCLACPLAAQDRMPRIPADQLSNAQKRAMETFKTNRGYELGGPFVPLLRSPEVMLRAEPMGEYLRFQHP